MKKVFLSLCMLMFVLTSISAQSSMSDDQIIKFVMKEQKAGSSQQEIVTKLIQKGVTIDQIRRVRQKAERMQKNQGLGAVKDKDMTDDEMIDERLRRNNGKEKNSSTEKLKDDRLAKQRNQQKDKLSKYGKNKRYLQEDATEMKAELDDFLPDSLDIYDRQVIRNYLKDKEREEGKDGKKIFGHDIFNNEDLTFEPNMNIATPENYILGAGDAVFVDIYGASQKSIQETVTPDGFIVIEDFGPIQVAGLTVAQANNRVRNQLGARYSSSKIRLSVGQTRTIVVNVMGEVKAPGTYTLSAFSSVFHALYMAGGPNEIGTLRNIKVYRHNKLVSTVDVYDYILNGKLSGNVRLGDDDVIVVGSYDCLVNVTGKVKRPMYYEMKKDESVGTLIDYAGGFTGDAYRKSVRVVRKSGSQYSVYNVNEFDMASFHMADNDSVSVDSILPRYSNMVEVKGAVFRPGMYQIGKNIYSVKTLLENAEGVTEEAFTQHAVMHRMKADRTLEVVAVDIEGIMSGIIADIPLKNEDVLFIPTKQESRVQQTIAIHGEVMYPGTYKYADNETLEDFVLQAGGLKENASMHNVLVSRRISNPNALTSDSILAQTFKFSLKDGFVIDGQPAFKLMPFDEVYVRQSPGYVTQQNVTIEGEVMFGGTYTLTKKNERLSDLFKRAGGGTDMAYIPGARLERKVNEAERIRLEELAKMRKEEKERIMQEIAINNSRSIDEMTQTIDKEEITEIPETYHVGIELDKALANPGGDADIVLREGDHIFIPMYSGTVKIDGEVMYPNSVAYMEGKSAKYYINQAGGYNRYAKKNQAYIIYMNGTVAKVNDGAKIRPGCEIVVPQKAMNRKMSITEYLAIGSTAASIATMGATLTNLLK
ncbi:MAG: SLBB domain-containing protein [Prevotella sp.]|nr:SLBB domain-containing protein [Prevotella sp.]